MKARIVTLFLSSKKGAEKMISKAELKRFEAYLIEEELAPNSIEIILRATREFFEQYPSLTKSNVLMWKQGMIEKYKPKTVNIKLSGLMRYAKYKEISINVKHIKIQKTISAENVITIEQYQYLMDSLKKDGNEQWYINILILAKTGARISEALRLTKFDALRGYADQYTKTKVRRIYIPAILTEQLKDYLSEMEDGDYLIQGIKSKRITSRGVAEAMQRLAKRYDIPKNVMHPHAFRHLFAVEFMKRNNNMFLLADLLGHSGVNTTMVYARMSAEQQQQELDKAVNW